MRIKTLLMAAALITATAATAQQTQDVVYLKNGSIIHGQVTEMKPDGNITIVNGLGDTLVFATADVDRTTKETVGGDASQSFLSRGYRGFVNFKGFLGCLNGGGITTTHGYQFNGNMYAGLGVGLLIAEDYHADDDGCNDDMCAILPIYGLFRYEFVKRRISPYAELSLGGMAGDVYGFMFSPMVGVRFNRFNMSAGMLTVPNAHAWGGDTETRNQFVFNLAVDFGRHNW